MKRLIAMAWIAVLAPTAQADDPDCEPAVDMIESHDAVNRMDECDYSNRGINAWLSGVLGARQANEEPARPQSDAPTADADSDGANPGELFSLRSATVGDALSLLQARFSLIEQAAARCESGAAVVEREAYQRESDAGLQLILVFSCPTP